jgi:hypothetical protein
MNAGFFYFDDSQWVLWKRLPEGEKCLYLKDMMQQGYTLPRKVAEIMATLEQNISRVVRKGDEPF